MITKRGGPPLRSAATLALVLIGALVGTACDSGSPATGPTAITQATLGATIIPAGTAGASETNTPQGSQANSNLDCQALADAAFDFASSEPFLVTLASAGGSVVNRVDTPFYVDTAKMRDDLNVLAALPDPTDATEISILGKPSEAIPQWRQFLDTIDKEANVEVVPGSTPTSNSLDDQQLLDFTTKIAKMSSAISNALNEDCPGVTAKILQPGQATQQPTPLPASFQIGQTAPVGDLRVTLDKIVTTQGSGGILPASGNQYVFVYITVENTGKNPSTLNIMTSTHWEDASGKQYFFDPNTIMLDPNTTNLDGGIQPGARKSGAVGYQLPVNAGDMVWVFQDFKPNQAVFAVKASDIAASGTTVSEPTEDAVRAQAAATQTAFLDMALSAAATEDAAGTETPAPPEPVDTAVPEDRAQPTDTAPTSP